MPIQFFVFASSVTLSGDGMPIRLISLSLCMIKIYIQSNKLKINRYKRPWSFWNITFMVNIFSYTFISALLVHCLPKIAQGRPQT